MPERPVEEEKGKAPVDLSSMMEGCVKGKKEGESGAEIMRERLDDIQALLMHLPAYASSYLLTPHLRRKCAAKDNLLQRIRDNEAL